VKVVSDDDGIQGAKSTETSFLSCRTEQNRLGVTRSLSETEPSGLGCLRAGLVSNRKSSRALDNMIIRSGTNKYDSRVNGIIQL